MTKQMYVFFEDGDTVYDDDEYFSGENEWIRNGDCESKFTIANLKFTCFRRPISQPTAPDTVCAQLRQVGDVAMTTGGLTKREWFAGMALSGLCVSYFDNATGIDDITRMAYKQADAMLKAGKETE